MERRRFDSKWEFQFRMGYVKEFRSFSNLFSID